MFYVVIVCHCYVILFTFTFVVHTVQFTWCVYVHQQNSALECILYVANNNLHKIHKLLFGLDCAL